MIILIAWALFVIGGWLWLKPGSCTRWNFVYQLPTNLFFGLNRTISGMIDGDMTETISSKLGRNMHAMYLWSDNDVKASMTKIRLLKVYLYYLVNLIALDPNHCRKYQGV